MSPSTQSIHWEPDPEALRKANEEFPRVNPRNPTELSDADWEQEKLAADQEWDQLKDKVSRHFEQVILDAMPSSDWARSGRHPRNVEKWFDRQLKRMLYEPRLASGGKEEVRTVMRLTRLARKLTEGGGSRLPAGAQGWLRMLAGKYRELTGRYYIFKMLPDGLRAAWEKARKEAIDAEDVEARRACETVLKGTPEWISDFVVEPLYVLVRENGTRERVVRIRNVHGEVTALLHWPAEEFASPKAMRIWLNNNANCANWAAGERELNYLGMDIGQALSDQTVIEITLRAHHYASGIWFWADCAMLKGKPLYQDRNGVYWHNGTGYLPSERDPEGEQFRQGPRPQMPGPFMHPCATSTDEEVKGIFQQAAQDLHDAVGSYAGWMALGAMLSFFASKEMFDEYAAIPGLWVSGESGHGKTSLVRWLMRIFGFQGKAGTPLMGSSQAGLRAALQQYGDMPLWMDEFQTRCEPWVMDMLKAGYDRGGTVKKAFRDEPREIRVGMLVSGIATSTDSQLRSRYCHVLVAKDKRIAFDSDRYRRTEKASAADFYKLGRFVQTHRAEFAQLMLDQVSHWVKDPKLVNCDDRSRIVHGATYGAFAALATLLQTHDATLLREFQKFVRDYIEGAQQDVRDQLYVTLYFEHLLGAERAGEFGRTPAELRRFFKVLDKPEGTADLAVSERQRELGREKPWCAWRGKDLCISSEGSVQVIRKYRRTLGITENLSRKDLTDQMKGRPYAVPPPAKGSHQVRFSGGQEVAWRIDLDQHEMGRLTVSDEEFEASLHKPDGTFYLSTEWKDPRKGPLFSLVEQLGRQDAA